MKKRLLLLIFLLLSVLTKGKNQVIILTDEQQEFSIGDRSYYTVDPNHLSLERVFLKFDSLSSNKLDVLSPGYSLDAHWIKIPIVNRAEQDWIVKIDFPLLDTVDFYYIDQYQNVIKHEQMGDRFPYDQRPFKHDHFLSSIPKSKALKSIYIRIKCDMPFVLPIKLHNSEKLLSDTINSNQITYLFYGAALLACLMNLILLFFSRQPLFLYLVIYTISYLLTFACFDGIAFRLFWPNSPWLANQMPSVTMGIALTAFLFFGRKFLILKKSGKTGLTILIGLNAVLSIFALLYTEHNTVDLVMTLSSLLVYIYMSILAFKQLKYSAPYYRLFVIGWLIFFISILTYALKDAGVLPYNTFTSRALYLGAFVEILLFTLSVAKKIRSVEAENKQKERIERKALQSSLDALRAQMNPHFVFNAMNSIQHFILKNQKEESSRYLGKFSKLIRSIFDNSRSQYTSVENEIESLEMYLDLEQMRTRQGFDYKIDVDEQLDTAYTQIPSLIIQPYVENAIWHGVMHKQDGKGLIEISIALENDKIRCSIQDNGIGRTASKERNKQFRDENHQSGGMQVTRNRLDLVNKLSDQQTDLQIEDLFDRDKAIGTRVTFTFPMPE